MVRETFCYGVRPCTVEVSASNAVVLVANGSSHKKNMGDWVDCEGRTAPTVTASEWTPTAGVEE